MATYKVIQDIEAEDHLLGPLTLRQFLYGIAAATSGYFCFLGVAKHAYPLLIVFFPIMLAAGFFAFPWGRDQPTEVWALAKIRFLVFPRKRIWNQAGMKELVTITAPKKVDTNYSDGLSQTEVKSRLKALADTIDSRGWATKNVAPGDSIINPTQSDRLVNFASAPQEVANVDIRPSDDILDEANNHTAATFDQMITSSEATHRQHLLDEMKAASAGESTPGQPAIASAAAPPPDNFWFMNSTGGAGQAPIDASVITPSSNSSTTSDGASDEAQLAATLRANKKAPQVYSSHLQTIQPLSAKGDTSASTPAASLNKVATTSDNASDDANDNAKIDESRRAVEQAWLANNNDLNIATIARQAHQKHDDDEVVISLH